MSILNEARDEFGFNNVWIYDGRILFKDKNDGQKNKKSIMIRIYYKALMVTIKMGRKTRLYIFF